MRVVFADAGYWIAMANPRDNLHERASRISKQAERIVTSDWVLAEVLNAFAESGTRLRSRAASLVQRVLANPTVEVTMHTNELFRDALALYQARPDKEWSLTDCASFLIMQEQEISDALTHDRHFEQQGFRS